MSWETDLLDASFRGVPFDMVGVNDEGQKSLALHEYPYRAGGNVEDMGRKARRIPIRALFWGEDYAARLQKLVAAFEEEGAGELVHPVYGPVQAVVSEWRVEHDAERPDYAALTFTAVEAQLDKPFFEVIAPGAKAANATAEAKTGVREALSATAHGVHERLGAVKARGQAAIDRVKGVVDEVMGIYGATVEVAQAVYDAVTLPQQFVAGLEDVASGALDRVGKGVSPFQRFGNVSGMLPRWSLDAAGILAPYNTGSGSYSARWISGDASRPEPSLAVALPPAAANAAGPDASGTGSTGTGIAGTVAPALGSARTPEGAIAAHLTVFQALLMTEAAGDLLAAELDAPTLTPDEVQAVAGNVRDRLQDGIDAVRAALPAGQTFAAEEGLRVAAHKVQELARAVLDARPPLVGVVADEPGNLHLLAHQLYGDFARADELHRLNPQVRNPNFVARGQELRAYAQ